VDKITKHNPRRPEPAARELSTRPPHRMEGPALEVNRVLEPYTLTSSVVGTIHHTAAFRRPQLRKQHHLHGHLG
jgi:hypothetical protein